MIRPPIVGDVAAVIGDCAQKVENRSLLLDKFIVHKSWPMDDGGVRQDDAVRWSFIRVTENGEAVLAADRSRQNDRANGRNTNEENKREARNAIQVIDKMTACACRILPTDVENLREFHVGRLIQLLAESSVPHCIRFGTLQSRLAINLSGGLIQNAGICLDRLFGVPYIPGSAVKGVCRHVALERLRNNAITLTEFQSIFGTADVDFKPTGELVNFKQQLNGRSPDQKGMVDFLAAYPTSSAPLEVDLTNVHFPEYYKTGKAADLMKESPLPNPFPVVKTGTTFAFCLALNTMRFERTCDEGKSILDKAEQLLREALEVSGFGAKTAAGYGWFADTTEQTSEQIKNAAALRRHRADEEQARKRRDDLVARASTELERLLRAPAVTQQDIDTFLGQFGAVAEEFQIVGSLNRARNRIPPATQQDTFRQMGGARVLSEYVSKFKNQNDAMQREIYDFFAADPAAVQELKRIAAQPAGKQEKKIQPGANALLQYPSQHQLPKLKS